MVVQVIPKMVALAAKAAMAAKAAAAVKTVMSVATIGSTVLGAYGAVKSGQEARAQGEAQFAASKVDAAQMYRDAGSASAASAIQVGRISEQGEQVASEFQAKSADNGFALGDQTSVEIASRIAAKTRMQELLETARGEDERQGAEYNGRLTELQGVYALQAGKRAQKRANLQAVGTVLSGAASMGQRFGGASGPVGYATSGSTIGNKAAKKALALRTGRKY